MFRTTLLFIVEEINNAILENYEVKDDDFFIILCDGKNLSINSRKKYANALKRYTIFHQLTLKQLLDEAVYATKPIAIKI